MRTTSHHFRERRTVKGALKLQERRVVIGELKEVIFKPTRNAPVKCKPVSYLVSTHCNVVASQKAAAKLKQDNALHKYYREECIAWREVL